ncbi:MAG: transcription antitermination factor NusB [Acidimicrobiia bacterium]
MSARAVAVAVLARVDDGAFANLALPAELRRSSLDARDRAFVTELVYGTLRNRRLVDSFITPHLSRSMASLDAPVRAGLRIGTYQLLEGIAPHASVSATVDAVQGKGRGLVNAVLRKVADANPAYPEATDVETVALATSHPKWLAQRFAADLGDGDAIAVMRANNERPVVTLRVRPDVDLDATVSELEAEGAHVERGSLVARALRVTGTGDPAGLAVVRDGRASPQDEASQAVVQIIDPQPGERILDLAAAPGGKAAAMAEHGAWVVASDRDEGRAYTMQRNFDRLGLGNVACLVADGTEPPFALTVHGEFDAVLLDAPCSGLGVLRRRPDARWRIQPNDVGALGLIQQHLLASAAELVRPGGRLVYSVCTLTSAETLRVDEWAARFLPNFEADPPPEAPWTPLGRGARLLPSAAGTDGMYVLRLRRTSSA